MPVEDDVCHKLDELLCRGQLEAAWSEAHRALDEDRGSRGPARDVAIALRAVLAALAAGHLGRAEKAVARAGEPTGDGSDAPLENERRAYRARVDAALGAYEHARDDAAAALRASDEAMPAAAAHARWALAEVALGAGDPAGAMDAWDDVLGRLRSHDQPLARRHVAEVLLASAEVLLDRDGPSDGSDASARLAEARRCIEHEGTEDLRLPLRLLVARARAAHGDEEGALAELEQLSDDARAAKRRDVEWRAHAACAALSSRRGAGESARRHDLAATEALEAIATSLPVRLRDGFWNDPRRAKARRQASNGGEHGRGGEPARSDSGEVTFHRPGIERRDARLFEIIKKLTGEHDLERLLERITDSAIELSGAERGFVLLLDEAGQLEPRLVRDAGTRPGDPSVAFSRSIAEAVLIDGEPLVTVDARDDHRLSEYLSVHKLMLRSVACLPIRSRGGPLGVLYLEHRMRRGRFHEQDFDLLLAFADQAAIAIENARLLRENQKRAEALASANRELEEAKRQIERVLEARTAELVETRQQLDRTRDELRGSYDRHGIVGRSEPMNRVHAVIDRVRDTDVPVVIQGESGTGKELVARAIHYGSVRAKGPFVAVNCAAIPEALLESELFGHVRGAFTGADRDRPGVLVRASGGSLFLDEVGDMPAKMQVDLLRVLQDGHVTAVGSSEPVEVDVRVISASNKSLRELVEQGRFREDLYYRLNVVDLRIPPLRERVADLPLLADHFLRTIANRQGVPPKRLSREALQRLGSHPLPGNVRQLEHLLLNACVMGEGETIEADDLALDDVAANDLVSVARGHDAVAAAASVEAASSAARAQSLDEYKTGEKQRILAALEEHGWNRARAASALGMARRTFYRRLKEHEILE